ncbi:MAG: hypothetical protein ACXVLO_08640 [Acidimicrobiia bacterium]
MVRPLLVRVAVGGAALLVVAGCSSAGSSKSGSTSTSAPAANVKAKAGIVDVVSAGAPKDLAGADRTAVLTGTADYVTAATIDPIERKKGTALSELFVASAASALTGPERDALTDTDVPPATGKVDATLAPVNVRGLADPSGAIDLVGTTVDLTVRATGARGPYTIHRTGELMFQRDGGAWKILGFKLAVTRDGVGLEGSTTSTTAKAST